MRIAIISDTHDQIANLRSAVTYCNSYNVQMLIHCGDLISPFMLDELAKFGGAVHLIYGNNVGDQHLISSRCGIVFSSISHHGVLGAVEAAGIRIAFHHYPVMARGIAAQGSFEVVCCGHNHRYQVEKIGDTLLINPGQLLGMDEQAVFAVLETATLDVEKVEIGEPLLLDHDSEQGDI